MKALVKKEAAPGIWLQDIPEPTVGPNDVLIEVAKTAICGTDMHIYNWDAWAQKTIPVPMAVGHEYCGKIVDLGSEVRGLAVVFLDGGQHRDRAGGHVGDEEAVLALALHGVPQAVADQQALAVFGETHVR